METKKSRKVSTKDGEIIVLLLIIARKLRFNNGIWEKVNKLKTIFYLLGKEKAELVLDILKQPKLKFYFNVIKRLSIRISSILYYFNKIAFFTCAKFFLESNPSALILIR